MRIFSPEVTVWAVFVDLESEVTCEKHKTPGLPKSSTPAATPVTSPGRRIASEMEELSPEVLAMDMKAGRRRQSSPEKRTGAQRPEEKTEPGEEGVGVLLAKAVQEGEYRPVSCGVLPLPIPFPEHEVVESERLRGLSPAVRSRVKRRVGWQGRANAVVRSVNEIFGKTATSEAGGRPSTMQLSSLSRICDAHREISAAECNSTAEAFKALCGSVPWLHWYGCQTGYLQGGPRFPARPKREDGRRLCSFDQGGLGSLEGLASGIASIAKRVPRSDRV